MNTGAISMRYARALLMFANEVGVAPQVYQEALTLRKSFREVPELKSALEKPVMTRENKSKVLNKLQVMHKMVYHVYKQLKVR